MQGSGEEDEMNERPIAPDLELPDSSRSRTIRLARDAGLIQSVGVEKPKWATYRKP